MTALLHDVDPAGLVWEAWRRHSDRSPQQEAIVHVSVGEEPYRWTWGALMRDASRAARWLSERGVRRGQVCALIVRHHRLFYPLYMGVSCLGALPSVLAYPNARLHPDKFRQGLEGMARRSGLDHIVTERGLEEVVAPLVAGGDRAGGSLLFPLEELEKEGLGEIADHAPGACDEPCLLQHSSGTTGLQKPVVLSHRALLEHVRRYGEAIQLTPRDKVISWLPLYHDMGLIAAFYLPLTLGIPVVQLSPMEWVSSPALLLQEASRERATLCWLPNFAYNFMADRIRDEDLAGVDLGSLRLLVNCSEPVRAESHERFYRRFSAHGIHRESLSACYAMAETTFAATQTSPGQEASRLEVDRKEMAMGNVVPVVAPGTGRSCVSSGIPVDGCQLRIVDDERRELAAGKIGEIVISSVSLFDGYRNYPEKTAEVLRDGWYYSGDYGFIYQGECYVVGRKKDVVIVAGNNVYPEDVEDVVARVPGVIPGRVVAFGDEDPQLGTEVLCVIAETECTADQDRRALKVAILKAGMAIDVTITRVYLVPPRWMIKSSSGKPARSTNKARALEDLAANEGRR